MLMLASIIFHFVIYLCYILLCFIKYQPIHILDSLIKANNSLNANKNRLNEKDDTKINFNLPSSHAAPWVLV